MLGDSRLAANGVSGRRKDQTVGNIVLMGSGEPLDNYDNVVPIPAACCARKTAVNIGLRSVSALDLRAGAESMRQFAEEDLPVTLSLSLHAPNDEVRRQTDARRQRNYRDGRACSPLAGTTSTRRGGA